MSVQLFSQVVGLVVLGWVATYTLTDRICNAIEAATALKYNVWVDVEDEDE